MEQTAQEFYLSVGGLCVRVVSRLPLAVPEGARTFLTAPSAAAVTISVAALEQDIDTGHAALCGQELHFTYYRDERHYYAVARAGTDGSVSTAVCTPDFSEIALYFNLRCFPDLHLTVDFVLQLVPLRRFLFLHQAMVLHSSRIYIGGRAILFSAPSQTGKSTQAALWQRYVGAEIVSNDRSVLRQEGDGCFTYGYPVDGSSPVFDNKRIPLGAVVMLAQGKENRVEQLSALAAVRSLTEQTSGDQLTKPGQIAQSWLSLTAVYPVYRLTCRPDREAVYCLKERLEKDGVI